VHCSGCDVLNVVDRVGRGGDVRDSHQAAYTDNLDKLAVYVTSRQKDLRHRADAVQCGFVTSVRWPGPALGKAYLRLFLSAELRHAR